MKSRFQENLNRGFQYQLIGTVETFLISKFYQKKHNLKKKYFSEKKNYLIILLADILTLFGRHFTL